MLEFNVKIAFRNLLKNKIFSSINILGLAISMASCLVIGTYIWNELKVDRFHKHNREIYRITEKQDQAGTIYQVAVTPGPLAPALKRDFPEIENTVRIGNWSGLLKNNGRNVQVSSGMLWTENSLFSMFDFTLLKGNPKTALGRPDEIIISESMARKFFGNNWNENPNLIGQPFTLNNQDNFKLAGIVKDIKPNSSIQFDVLLPLEYLFQTDNNSNKWNSNNYHTYIQLKKGTVAKAFAAKTEKQLQTYLPQTNALLQLQPLQKQYLYSKFDFQTDWGLRSNITYINIFSGVGILLLIIACINFINLSTARSLKRSLEVGVRKVTGATRKQLVSQFLIESILVALISGVIAVVVIKFIQPLLFQLTGYSLELDLSSLSFLVLFSGSIIVVGLIAGLYPAFVLSAFKPITILSHRKGNSSGKNFRQGLVVFQFAISIALIICTIFMYRQLTFIQQKDLGFEQEQLITVGLPGKLMTSPRLFKEDLEKQTSIVAAAPATMSLVNVDNSTYMEWEGMKPDDKFLITQANVDPDFIPALGMKLLNGRNFSPQITNDTATFIVNEAAAKRMGYNIADVIGKKVVFWGATGTIIGVVKDFHFKPLNTTIDPFILRYQPQDRYFKMFVKTAPGKTKQAISDIEKIYKKYETESPLQFSFLSESINAIYQNDKRIANIVLLFAALTIFVGCLGLFGLTVFAAEQRIKEIGIRKVLGAGVATLTALLLKDYLKLVLGAAIIATPVAWYVANKWLQEYAFRINTDWWVFALAGLAVLLLAVITISVQAINAAKANPVKALKSE
jgi:putative ABC transport system permease protein